MLEKCASVAIEMAFNELFGEPQPQGNPVIYPEPQGEKEASEAPTRGTQVNVPSTPFDEPEEAKNAENGNPKAGRTLV